MPKGANLWISNPAHTHTEGPYTAANRSRHGRLWTPLIKGDEIVIEVFVPTSAVGQPVIEIGKVYHGYRGLDQVGMFGNSEAQCQADAKCPAFSAWGDQVRAVGLYTVGGNACTGTLLNNTNFRDPAYFHKPY